MNKLVNTKGMPHSEWLEWRKKGLGGSDMAAVMGMNPFCSAVRVYLDKTNQIPPKEANTKMELGKLAEKLISQFFTIRTGHKVRKNNHILQHSEHLWMLANIDGEIPGLVDGKKIGLEFKFTDGNNLSKFPEEGEEPPSLYYIQNHAYLTVTEWDEWWTAVLFGNRDLRVYKTVRNEGVSQSMLTVGDRFWNHYVKGGIMPPPDDSDDCYDVLAEYYGKKVPSDLIANFDDNPTVGRLIENRDRYHKAMKESEGLKKEMSTEIAYIMGELQLAYCNGRKITYKPLKSGKRSLKVPIPK